MNMIVAWEKSQHKREVNERKAKSLDKLIRQIDKIKAENDAGLISAVSALIKIQMIAKGFKE